MISQDTSAYGLDIKYQPSLWKDREVRTRFFELARELGELGMWVRMHYVYPYPHVDEVIPLMAEGKILPYLDIPFQHASPRVLKSMRRPGNQEKTLERIHKWREICPDLAIRSTFIVGFPGETEEDVDFLMQWLKDAKIDRAGCFQYEPVQGAPANDIDGAVPPEVKEERWHRFMQTQQKVSAKILKAKVGKTPARHHRRAGRDGGHRPHEIRRPRDRRRRLCGLEDAPEAGRDRQREDRELGRVRPARDGGLIFLRFPHYRCERLAQRSPLPGGERSSAARVRGRALSGEGVDPSPAPPARPLPQGEVKSRQILMDLRPSARRILRPLNQQKRQPVARLPLLVQARLKLIAGSCRRCPSRRSSCRAPARPRGRRCPCTRSPCRPGR